MKFSSIRIIHSLDYIDDLEKVMISLIEAFTDLYNICSEKTTLLADKRCRDFEIPKLELIKDISIKASEFLEKHPILKEMLYVDKEGLHYKERADIKQN